MPILVNGEVGQIAAPTARTLKAVAAEKDIALRRLVEAYVAQVHQADPLRLERAERAYIRIAREWDDLA